MVSFFTTLIISMEKVIPNGQTGSVAPDQTVLVSGGKT
jgi:hypothetical protein